MSGQSLDCPDFFRRAMAGFPVLLNPVLGRHSGRVHARLGQPGLRKASLSAVLICLREHALAHA
jgi:hypothetical protein